MRKKFFAKKKRAAPNFAEERNLCLADVDDNFPYIPHKIYFYAREESMP